MTSVEAGYWHSVALRNDGTMWTWGHNDYGELGDGTTDWRSVPVQVSGLTGIAAIAAGPLHTVAVKSDGSVWAWGENGWGQLGVGTTSNFYPVPTPVQASGITGATAVAVGYGYTVALKNDGTVWAWGDNEYGQLGDGTSAERHSAVQASGLAGVQR
jgi:alpha-tubulin suppressor-like RCC1 family protein